MKDIIIIGSGSAGMAASVYAKRFELDIVCVGEIFGGTITKTHIIENWPGIKSISGFELGMNFVEHAKSLGTEILNKKVLKIKKDLNGNFISHLDYGEKIESKTVIYATGSEHKELGLDSEQRLKNKGVSYCATCDGAFFRGKIVAIIGGSDSAVKESLLLAKYASKVYIIYRGNFPRAEPINMSRMKEEPKIELVLNSNVVEILGENKVSGVKLDTGKILDLDGVFVQIGSSPNIEPIKDLGVNLTEKNEIIIDKFGNTNIEGFFAGGDITNNHFRQAIVSSAEGAFCANSAYEYLQSKK